MTPLQPRTGATRDGLPVSTNAAAPADLADHVARFFVTIIDQPEDQTTPDILLNETAMVRVLVRGQWERYVPNRGWRAYRGALLFGPQRRAMRVRCTGPMAVAGFAVRPGDWPGIAGHRTDQIADELIEIDGAWGEALRAAVAKIDDHHGVIARLEAAVRDQVAGQVASPDPAVFAFERIARAEPTRPVAEIAAALELEQRPFTRLVCHAFGHTPKLILRRSRFLDMAAVVRGLAVPDADTAALLRVYDRSHMNREFRLFVDMTPAEFERTPTPLMTPGLEVRQQRKLQDLAALPPGVPAPWLAPTEGIETPPRDVGAA